jgi:hypothetical protein
VRKDKKNEDGHESELGEGRQQAAALRSLYFPLRCEERSAEGLGAGQEARAPLQV